MSLLSGSRIGPYEIVSPLGAGGMGEVYRARDAKLGRDVAIKILPAVLAADPERLARFEREARLLAALNHPHIAAIYGFEASGDVRGLVLELVEGETLAEKLARGPLPLTEALEAARQIADALDAAHERGIVHRDLKPANIKITPGGAVKVLDFGLAKAAAADACGDGPDRNIPVRFHGRRPAARHRALHESRAGSWPAGGQANGHLGVRVRVVRNAGRSPAVFWRHRD